MKIDFLLLEGPYEPFSIPILPCPPLACYGYLYPCISKKRNISLGKIPNPIVRVMNLGLGMLKSFLKYTHHKIFIKTTGDLLTPYGLCVSIHKIR